MRSGFLAAAGLAAAVVAQAPTYGVVDELIPGNLAFSLVADLDGDLDFDLLGADVAMSALDDGTGRFVPGWAGSPSFVAPNPRLADLDGDGLKDLLYGAGSVSAWRRGVPGGFQATANPLPIPPILFSALRAGVGDVDADGDLDVLIASPPALANWVRLFANDGTGVFIDATAAAGVAATAFNGAKLVDLDGDGLSDVLAWNRAPSAPVHVQRNLGGTFAALQTLAVPGITSAVVVDGDFDVDGLVDVIVYGAPDVPIQFLRHTSPFTFATEAPPALAPGAPFGMRDGTAADLDGDGKPELVLAGDRGTATFTYGPSGWAPYVAETPAPATLVLGAEDLDADGDADLVVRQSDFTGRVATRVIRNGGASGLFVDDGNVDPKAGTTVAKLTDLDGDGDLDVIGYGARGPVLPTTAPEGAEGGVWTAVNDGMGGLTPFLPAPVVGAPGFWFFPFAGTVPAEIATADFDLDGDLDLFVAGGFDGVQMIDALVINDGSGGWTATTSFAVAAGPVAEVAFAVAVGDLDGDAYPDVVVSRNGGGFRAYRNLGGTLALQPLGVTSTGKHHVLADFDGDGDLDIATRQGFGPLQTFNNLGGFTFVVGSSYGLPPLASDPLHVMDLDGDADPDLVVGRHLALNVGAFAWSYPSQTASPIPATSFPRLSVDFDGDGDFDLLAQEGAVTRNLGGGVFAPWFTLPSQTTRPAAGDVDGDGLVDLLLRGPTLHVDVSRRLALRRPARPGFLTGFDLYGPAGGAWLLGVNADPLPTPPTTTPYGRLFLDPFTLTLVGGGALDAAGFAAVEALLPASAASLIGSTFHFQAVVDGAAAGPRLTNARSLVVTPP